MAFEHETLLLGLGVVILLVAWVPLLIRKLPLSLAIFFVAIGYVGIATGVADTRILTKVEPYFQDLAEAVLLVALMGAGLKIDRAFHWRSWGTTWRLLGIAMPLTIAATVLLCVHGGQYAWAAALLIAGAVAPTDPVLASDVAVGPPGTGEDGEVRFGLTSEAGLNDGLALPFVATAVALALGQTVDASWIGWHFLWKPALAVGLGWGVGWFLGLITFHLPHSLKLSETGDGLVALGIILLSFALTESFGGYGFIAVFVTALSLRASAPRHDFHKSMAGFSEQVERLLLMIVLIFFGGAIASGLLDGLTWVDAGIAAALIFVIRPASGMIAQIGAPYPLAAKFAIAFFGIRGVGTFYYLLFAFGQSRFPQQERLWPLCGLIVLLSICVHGLSSTPLMQRLDRQRERHQRELSERRS